MEPVKPLTQKEVLSEQDKADRTVNDARRTAAVANSNVAREEAKARTTADETRKKHHEAVADARQKIQDARAERAAHPVCPLMIGEVICGCDLAETLKDDHGEFECTRAGRTDRVRVDGGVVTFVPSIPEEHTITTDEEWIIKKVAD